MNKYTIAQILSAWEAAFGEDMMTEYPGFIQRLTEEQAPSCKLQATSFRPQATLDNGSGI